MEELISRIKASVGLSDETAKQAVGVIMDFLRTEGPADRINELMASIPGATELADSAAGTGGGGFLSSMMGGAMGAFTKLQGLGLDLDQVQGVTSEVVGFAKEKTSPETVDEIIAAIPGLGQFV